MAQSFYDIHKEKHPLPPTPERLRHASVDEAYAVQEALQAMQRTRSILGNIGVLVLPDQIAVPKAHEAFTPDGALKDGSLQAKIEKLAASLAETISKLRG